MKSTFVAVAAWLAFFGNTQSPGPIATPPQPTARRALPQVMPDVLSVDAPW